MEIDRPFAVNHFSVDCVIFGFDGENLNVLLLHRKGEDNGESFHDMKLPGSLIYQDEDLDEAAKRVLNELTGLKNLKMIQFKAFGSKDRPRNPKDVHWLEKVEHTRVTRIVTVVYLALVKIDRSLNRQQDNCLVEWVPMTQIRTLAFDHNRIIKEAVEFLCQYVRLNPAYAFELLPKKFTMAQLRSLYEALIGTSVDIRNFHKKMIQKEYIIPLDEYQQGVAHRAARYYRFDKKILLKTKQLYKG